MVDSLDGLVCQTCGHDEPHTSQRGFCPESGCDCDAPVWVLPEDDSDDVTLDEMLATGATYRQIDNWIRRGYVRAAFTGPGSGHARKWTPEDREIVALMVAFTNAGMMANAAARWAAMTVDPETVNAVETGGVVIRWERT